MKSQQNLDNKSLNHYPLKVLSTKRAVLSQANRLSFPFTASEIIMMGRDPYLNDSNKNQDVVLKALECVDGLHLKDRFFPTLSGGEQQRIHFARVLAQLWEQKNAYLFLDEPTAALDLKHQHQLLRLVTQWAKQKNFAVCIIMHDLHLALRYAHDVILLKNGKLVAAGEVASTLTPVIFENLFEVSEEMAFASSSLL